MNPVVRIAVTLLASTSVFWAAYAGAQDCSAGDAKFHLKLGGVEVSCSQGSCHGPDPRNNANGILTPGKTASGINDALNTVAEMADVRSGLGLTSADIDNLALYIKTRADNEVCGAAAAPAYSASATSLAFGTVQVGQTSASQSVTITNTGTGSGTINSRSNSDTTQFPVSGTCTSVASLAAGASCTLAVSFKPGAAGPQNASYTFGTGSTTVSVPFSGSGQAPSVPNVSASSTSLSFGNVTTGTTSGVQTITVSNTGTGAATNMSYPAAPSNFTKGGTCSSATLNAGASCTVTFSYSPTSAVAANATYTITGGGATINVSLSGAGVAPTGGGTGQLSMPAGVNVPDTSVGSSSAPQIVTIGNTGSATVAVTSITSSDAAEFGISASTCASVVAGVSCSFAVTFAPAATGLRSAVITIASDGTGSPQTILVSGTGLSTGGGGTPPPPPNAVAAIEYYHAAFDHYFITAIADEITKLDNGTFVGWARTGRQFKVFTATGAALSPVCRFFSTSFAPKSSHFYTASTGECTVVKANADWQFEAEVFFVATPAADGTCAGATVPVYRLYNNGQGAAPNHRLTTDLAVRTDMMGKGWIPEGFGVGVTMCAPS